MSVRDLNPGDLIRLTTEWIFVVEVCELKGKKRMPDITSIKYLCLDQNNLGISATRVYSQSNVKQTYPATKFVIRDGETLCVF